MRFIESLYLLSLIGNGNDLDICSGNPQFKSPVQNWMATEALGQGVVVSVIRIALFSSCFKIRFDDFVMQFLLY